MSDNITREPYRNAWYKQLADAVKKHDEEIAEMTPHLVPEVEEGDNGKILIAGEDGAFDWGQPPEELPIITEGDEGKVLKVDEGVPKWLDDNDNEYLMVTITRGGTSPNYTYTADKPFSVIKEYYDKGKVVVFYRDFTFIPIYATSSQIRFILPYNTSTSSSDIGGYERFLYKIDYRMFFINSDDTINYEIHLYDMVFTKTISNNETLSDKNYNALVQMSFSNNVIVNYNTGNKVIRLYLLNGDGTTADYINIYEGIKAHIDANKLVTITEIPTLPQPTSADEGKVVMVDSNGDYVLGVASAGYIIPYTTEQATYSDNTEVPNNA